MEAARERGKAVNPLQSAAALYLPDWRTVVAVGCSYAAGLVVAHLRGAPWGAAAWQGAAAVVVFELVYAGLQRVRVG